VGWGRVAKKTTYEFILAFLSDFWVLKRLYFGFRFDEFVLGGGRFGLCRPWEQVDALTGFEQVQLSLFAPVLGAI
jgi:hypothetical protein